EGSHCAICGAVLTKQKVIPKLKAAKLKSLTGGKSSFTAKWNKVKGVDGYQLQYSLSKKFKNKKTVTVKSAKSIKKTVKKLKAKKTYYVRIRAYKTVSGKKLYSKWSKAEKTATK
ncbi:MAG: fibronectin type III domain-containing protein, partial [Eubacterium sp.]|nr:fibronectin type III domain-containing protein [Eubacterium sp.]